MVKKGFFLSFLCVFLVLISFNLVSANFACGTVVTKDNSSNIATSWFNVKIFYSEKPNIFTSCKVSPENSRYCCNPREITNVSWAVGKVVNAEIDEYGYIAEKVNMSISGAGYDVFPDLRIEKAVEFYEPNITTYNSNSSIFVRVKSAERFNQLSYQLANNSDLLFTGSICSDCNIANLSLSDLQEGKYYLIINASNSVQSYVENVSFFVLKNVNFTRAISCEGCKGNRVPSGVKLVNISVGFNSSLHSDGIFRDFFPSDWIYQGDLDVYEYTDSHSYIEWEFNASESVFEYSLIPPRNLFNSKYKFQSHIGNIASPETVISLSKFWFLDFLGVRKHFIKYVNSENVEKNVYVSPENPIVLYPKNIEAEEVYIFPKNEEKNVLTAVKKTNSLEFEDSISSFMIWTTIDSSNIDKIIIKLVLDKNKLKKNKSFYLYNYDNLRAEWSEVDLNLSSENDKSFTYTVQTDKIGGYSIVLR